MTAPGLKPRAIALLCALRLGARTSSWLRSAVGDRTSASLYDLLLDLRKIGLVRPSTTGQWHLTHDGIGWCESNGMLVSPAALDAASCDFSAIKAVRP